MVSVTLETTQPTSKKQPVWLVYRHDDPRSSVRVCVFLCAVANQYPCFGFSHRFRIIGNYLLMKVVDLFVLFFPHKLLLGAVSCFSDGSVLEIAQVHIHVFEIQRAHVQVRGSFRTSRMSFLPYTCGFLRSFVLSGVLRPLVSVFPGRFFPWLFFYFGGWVGGVPYQPASPFSLFSVPFFSCTGAFSKN